MKKTSGVARCLCRINSPAPRIDEVVAATGEPSDDRAPSRSANLKMSLESLAVKPVAAAGTSPPSASRYQQNLKEVPNNLASCDTFHQLRVNGSEYIQDAVREGLVLGKHLPCLWLIVAVRQS